MTRLNSYLRDEILKNAMAKSPIPAEEATLESEYYALAEAFRLESLGGPKKAAEIEHLVQEIEKLRAQLPDSIKTDDPVATTDYEMYRMNLGGLRVRLKFAPGYEDRRIRPAEVVFAADHPLVLQFGQLENRKADLTSKRATLKQQVQAVLASVTTVKKLLEVWPEAKELLPQNVEGAKPQLPALPIADVNALIGLPSV